MSSNIHLLSIYYSQEILTDVNYHRMFRQTSLWSPLITESRICLTLLLLYLVKCLVGRRPLLPLKQSVLTTSLTNQKRVLTKLTNQSRVLTILTTSLTIPTVRHFWNLQNWHRFRLCLSSGGSCLPVCNTIWCTLCVKFLPDKKLPG